MIDEKELIDLMTKTGEAYFRDKIEEGNLYAKELLHKLDFSEKRDQEAMLQVLGHALVRHDEIGILDELKDAGFDFNMVLERGITLSVFFSQFPKFNSDDRIYKKLEELGAASVLESVSAEKLLKLIEENIYHYNLWWEKEEQFSDPQCRIVSEELNETVLKYSREISKESAEKHGEMGLTVLHQLVWHNYFEATEILLKNGINPNIGGTMGKGRGAEAYLGVTPLHLACYMGNYKMVKLLVDNGADTTLCDDRGRSCFHYIASLKYEDIKNNLTGQFESMKQRADIIPLLQCDINAKDKDGLSPLLQLVSNSWSQLSQNMIQVFLENGADSLAVDNDGNTALIIAARTNQITAAIQLIKNKSLIDLQNNDGDTALHVSAREGNFEISYVLLDLGADCQIENNSGETAAVIIENGYCDELKNRIGKRRPPALKELIRTIENAFFHCNSMDNDKLAFGLYFSEQLLKEIDEDDDEELSYVIKVLQCALRADEECRILDTIVNAGYDLEMPICYAGNITNVRDCCLKEAFDTKVIEKLQNLGTDLNTALVKGKTPANIVAGMSKREVFFTKNEADYYAEAAKFFSRESMEELDLEGMAAVHQAARNDHVEMLQVMIDKGIDVNLTEDAPQEIGTTPLHVACIYGNPKIVKLLMDSGADDSMKNSLGETPAHYVVQKKQRFKELNSEVRTEMLEALSDVDTPRNDGKTPIILLQDMDYNIVCDITRLLIDKGVDLNHADNNGNTVLLAHTDSICNKDVVKELIRAGADINAKNNIGNTALHHALRYGNCDVARFLIKKGADYNAANNKGETPLQIAAEKGYETVLELMID